MSAVTRGVETSNSSPESKISVLMETLALFFVLVALVAMVLAMATVFQNGFQ